MSKTLLTLLLLAIGLLIGSCTHQEYTQQSARASFLNTASDWADSTLLQLTLEEKVGQLIFLDADAPDSIQQKHLFNNVLNKKLSGILLQKLPLKTYATIIDSIQSMAEIPLLTIGNQSVAPNNNFTDQVHYPTASTIAALDNDTINELLQEKYLIKAQALQLDMIIGPELNETLPTDVFFNKNIGIQTQSKLEMTALNQMTVFQENGILSFANSFRDLIFIENDTLGITDSLLWKYSNLIRNGLSGMVIDTGLIQKTDHSKQPKNYIRQYIRQHLNFDGILLGAARDTQSLKALVHAGADVFLVNQDIENYHALILRMVKAGHFPEKELNEKVYKVLMAKAWKKDPLDPIRIEADQITEIFDIPFEPTQIVNYYRQSIILAKNPKSLIPIKQSELNGLKIIQVGKKKYFDIEKSIRQYADFSTELLVPNDKNEIKPLKSKWLKRPMVLIFNQINLDSTRNEKFLTSLNTHAKASPTIIVNIGNPLNLRHLDTTIAVVQVFDNNEIIRQRIPQLIFGGVTTKGKLPLAISPNLPVGAGESGTITRLAYVNPREVGIDPVKLVGVDALVNSAIQKGITPGAQVMFIKNGKVFYNKTFGHHNYDRKNRVKSTDLYDIASLTKVTATTLATMKNYEDKKINLSNKLVDYLSLEENKSLGKITLKRLLTHQSGLQANMPVARYILYKDSLNRPCNDYYCKTKKGKYNVQIADSVFMHQKWQDTMWQEVFALTPKRRKRFKYSDVNFNLLQKVIEAKTGMPIDNYLHQTFYESLGLRHFGFNPRDKYDPKQLIPTAQDDRWRHQQLHGYVHDESAALLGGVAGNAGLFSNANDLGILFQMLLNGGTYGGKTYLKPETIDYFTKARHGNHRGLGFDSKTRRRPPSCGKNASNKTYGHTGFTGTCVWVDSKEDLIFIFLSNRIAPNVKNKKLFRSKLRSRIHDLVYDALDTFK